MTCCFGSRPVSNFNGQERALLVRFPPVTVAQVRTVFPMWRAGRLHRGSDAESREAWITIHMGEGGEMVLEKQAFAACPAGC